MSYTAGSLAIGCAFFCLVLVVLYARIFRLLLRLPKLEDCRPEQPDRWPALSVVVPACDEALTLPRAVSTLLAQDYLDLEIILVDDRSRDGTGEIIESLARQDSRIRPVHVRELPPGWLGKVHALAVGTSCASGEWLLYSDADTEFGAGTLRKAVGLSLENGWEHLVLFPGFREAGFALQVVLHSFLLGALLTLRADRIGREGARSVVGAGAFSLVSRQALERSAGFSWLRMEVVDDLGLGLLLQRAGVVSHFLVARKDLGLRWYPSVRALVRGLEKNSFAGARYSYWAVGGLIVGMFGLLASPLAALLSWRTPWLWAGGAAVILALTLVSLVFRLRFGAPILPTLLSPAGAAVLTFTLARAAILCAVRGGIEWRGTRYSLRELRRGQRLKL